MKRSVIFFLAYLSALCFSIGSFADTTLVYPKPGAHFEAHHLYPKALLELALSKAPGGYKLLASENFMQQGRALKQLQQGKEIDVMWTMTSAQRESILQAVRIPIYKGLIGWRVFLSNDPEILQAEQPLSLDALKSLTMIQGHDWPDTKILRHNGFQVADSPSYAGLFKMIELRRAKLFPRSIIEVWDELSQFESQEVGLEQHTLISYPTASYFFVAKEDQKLARDLKSGLLQALDDGSFDRLFRQHFGEVIDKAKLDKRKRYQLANPLLTPETPIDEPRFWFSN